MTNVQRYTGCNHIVTSDGTHISLGNDPVKIRYGDKEWTFEWHHYCGPSELDRRGDPKARQPGPRSPFWLITVLWKDQGCETVDGVAVYRMPKIVTIRCARTDEYAKVYKGYEHYRILKAGEQ